MAIDTTMAHWTERFGIRRTPVLKGEVESWLRCLSPPHVEHLMRSRQALKLHLLGLSELELPATLDQRLQQRRHENLLTLSLGGYPARLASLQAFLEVAG